MQCNCSALLGRPGSDGTLPEVGTAVPCNVPNCLTFPNDFSSLDDGTGNPTGYYLYTFDAQISWEEARLNCGDLAPGAHLARPETAPDFDLVLQGIDQLIVTNKLGNCHYTVLCAYFLAALTIEVNGEVFQTVGFIGVQG